MNCTLPKEDIQHNQLIINNLKKSNNLVKRVCRQETTFTNETDYLFSAIKTTQNPIKIARKLWNNEYELHEDHDKRLKQLLEPLNNMQIYTAEAQETKQHYQNKLSAFKPQVIRGPGTGLGEFGMILGMHNRIETYGSLEKALKKEEFDAKAMKSKVERSKNYDLYQLGMHLIMPITTYVVLMALRLQHPNISHMDCLMAAGAFGAVGSGIQGMVGLMNRDTQNKLELRASYADQFMKTYYFKQK